MKKSMMCLRFEQISIAQKCEEDVKCNIGIVCVQYDEFYMQ